MRLTSVISDIIQIVNRDHGDLTGLTDDDHTAYLNNTRHDSTARHTLGSVVPHDSLAGITDVPATSTADYGKPLRLKHDGKAYEFASTSPTLHAAAHKDGGVDELDASELAGGLGTANQYLQTDGSACTWATVTAGMTVKSDTLSTTGAQSISISSLDLDTDKHYLLMVHGLCKATDAGWIRMYYNDDTLATDYYEQRLRANDTTLSGARSNDPKIGWGDPDDGFTLHYNIARPTTSHPIAVGTNIFNLPDTILSDHFAMKWSTSTNVTKITLTAEQANCFATGTRVTLLKAS